MPDLEFTGVREAEALADRISQVETEAGRAAHAAELERDRAARHEAIQVLQARLQSQEQQLLDARADLVAFDARVKQLETDLASRNAQIVQLQRTADDRDTAMAHSREDFAARERTISDLRIRIEKLQRQHDELRGTRLQGESAIGRLQAVLKERTAMIERLEKAASLREDLLSQLQRDLADRAAWAYRTVDALVSAQLTRAQDAAVHTPLTEHSSSPHKTLASMADGQRAAATDTQQVLENPSLHEPPGLREPELIAARGSDVRTSAHIADTGSELNLLRHALEAEQRERQRLEGIVGEGYTQLKRRIVETVERLVPRGAMVAVVSRGDEDLLRLNRRRGCHFPQTEMAVYAGHYPADSAAAIDHLEKLRTKGTQFLVFPATSCWWLTHYSQFADHLARRYRRILERDDVGVVFDVRRARALRPDWKTDLAGTIEDFQARFRRDPAILDYETGLDVAASFPQHTVFSPPHGASGLPYLDATVDVVMCRARSPRTAEARRVASTLLLTVSAASNGARRAPTAVRLRADWLEQKPARTPSAVSIIIPCHNGARLTQSCLAAVEATLPSSFRGEVIVIDDASTDGTRAMLARWAKRNTRVRVLRNSRNIGFLRSCNRAAKAARGEMLVLLNNDTQPVRGWLTALLRTFDDHPDAGAVGGKLVFPDGTLQEAGNLVFRDGSAANFGRGDRNPDHPLFNHVRQVDYCSAALLATPRRLFLELGGFDSRYIPAYYEDTDYCFKLRDKGYCVYYQPAARVIHHEGASCGTDLTQGVKRHQTVNRERFRDRWKTVLERQPERPQEENLDAWRRLSVRSA